MSEVVFLRGTGKRIQRKGTSRYQKGKPFTEFLRCWDFVVWEKLKAFLFDYGVFVSEHLIDAILHGLINGFRSLMLPFGNTP